jgi:hypothetical protein
MIPSDLGLSPLAMRLFDATTPEPLRLLAARGLAPALPPAEVLFVAYFLASDAVSAVHEAARATLATPPRQTLTAAIDGARSAAAIELLAAHVTLDQDATAKLFRHALATDELRAQLVARAPAETFALLAAMDAIVAVSPATLRALYNHREASAAVRARCHEFASSLGLALAEEAAPASPASSGVTAENTPSAPPQAGIDPAADAAPELDLAIEAIHLRLAATVAADDETSEAQRVLPLAKLLEGLSVSQKIRRATIGSAEERAILVRDTNRLVAEAAITSPRLQENEVLRFAANRSVSSEVLRRIAESREWMKSYPVKVVLAQNPRLPLPLALRLLPMLREADLKRIATSRSVAGAVSAAAKREMQKKQG